MASQRCRVALDSGWSFIQTDRLPSSDWMLVKKVPSTVHQDLMDNGRLEDPFIDMNEIKAEWVADKSWTYQTKFRVPEMKPGCRVVLVFEGLDTFARVKLDDQLILESDNMFLPYHVEVTKHVKPDSEHILEIEFEPALAKGEEIRKRHPEHKWLDFVGETSRPAVRKAQYHWGWDWGPILTCAGIFRPIYLETYHARIDAVRTDIELAPDLKSARVHVNADFEGGEGAYAHISLLLDGSVVVDGGKVPVTNAHASTVLDVETPKLWMPVGYGSQPLYDVRVVLFSDSELDSHSQRLGFRKVELVQEQDQYGKSFYFRVNNVDIFCGGANWIPTDSFLTNVDSSRYRRWIELMVAGNQNMIRVWAGGIYEDDALYDACDELGVLVFQDFMFACANYPAYPSFVASVTAEAKANIRRLRHHPSIVLFAGNNEDYQVQEALGLTYNYADKSEENWLKTDFPARYLYESVLPKVVKDEAPWITYHPGSPWGDGKLSFDPTVGDKHAWGVWHSPQHKYQIFDKIGGRFNSEFGMSAFPHLSTVKRFVSDPRDLWPQSEVIDFHNKADGHDRRVLAYMVENVPLATDLRTYIHNTQLVQSDALTVAYRGWRRQWGDRKCGGALVWQLNDCWPAISWAICDYYMVPKPSYHVIRRALAPIAVGIQREHHNWSGLHPRTPETTPWELWAVNSSLRSVPAEVELRFISVASGTELRPAIRQKAMLAPNGTTEILSGKVNNFDEEPHVLAARLFIDGQIVARDMDWPQPLKYLQFPDRNVRVEYTGGKAHVRVDRPVKCLVFDERPGLTFSDNGLDLAPGDEQVVTIGGLDGSEETLSHIFLAQAKKE